MVTPHLNLHYSNTAFEANNNRQSKKQDYTAVERTLRNNTPQNETFSHNTGATTFGMMNFSPNNITPHGYLKEFQSHFTKTIQGI